MEKTKLRTSPADLNTTEVPYFMPWFGVQNGVLRLKRLLRLARFLVWWKTIKFYRCRFTGPHYPVRILRNGWQLLDDGTLAKIKQCAFD